MASFGGMVFFFAGTVFLFAWLATAAKVLKLAWAICMIIQAAATVSENMAKCHELIRNIGSFFNRFQEEANNNEHMYYGTLRNHLLTDGRMSWIARVQVLLGVACYIKHLHCLGVIHNNVTSSNILLDQSLTPRVSGFGVLVRQAQGVLSLAVDVVQTYWYADPDYHSTDHRKAIDVRNFGVVMLEVLTGNPTDTPRLVSWARHMQLRDVLDRRPAPEPTQREWEALELVARTTEWCLEPHWYDRPAISDIVADLEEALNLIYNDQ